MSPLPNGDQASRTLSVPAKTCTPELSNSFTGGMAPKPEAAVKIATPALANFSAVAAATDSLTIPSA